MSKTFLVVDDVKVTRFFADEILQQLGFEAICVANSSEALKALHSAHNFDGVLLDWHIQNESGLELMKQIHKDVSSSIPVIMFSGVEGASGRQEAMQQGAADFLQKPTTKEKLESSLQQIGLL